MAENGSECGSSDSGVEGTYNPRNDCDEWLTVVHELVHALQIQNVPLRFGVGIFSPFAVAYSSCLVANFSRDNSYADGPNRTGNPARFGSQPS